MDLNGCDEESEGEMIFIFVYSLRIGMCELGQG